MNSTAILPFYLPFQGCAHQCVYCNQPLIVGAHDERGAWDSRLETLGAEPGREWEIAFYAGTFSALPRETMDACFDRVAPWLQCAHVRGVRVSTRPDRVSGDMLDYLKSRGVRTIELGVESFDDEVLRRAGRGHDARTAEDACERVRNHGFSLGVHLMTGLPGQNDASWRETVSRTAAIKPDLARIAPTLVLRGTPLEALFQRGRYTPQPLEEAIQQCAHGYARLRRAGVAIARVGLALSDERGDGSDKIVAGPWHPALRHEVESRLARQVIGQALLRARTSRACVNPKDYSIAIGSKKSNLAAWRESLSREVVIERGEEIPRHHFTINTGEPRPLFWSPDD